MEAEALTEQLRRPGKRLPGVRYQVVKWLQASCTLGCVMNTMSFGIMLLFCDKACVY